MSSLGNCAWRDLGHRAYRASRIQAPRRRSQIEGCSCYPCPNMQHPKGTSILSLSFLHQLTRIFNIEPSWRTGKIAAECMIEYMLTPKRLSRAFRKTLYFQDSSLLLTLKVFRKTVLEPLSSTLCRSLHILYFYNPGSFPISDAMTRRTIEWLITAYSANVLSVRSISCPLCLRKSMLNLGPL